tara:strand:+ start:493 stop:957 length:465 start_codon:yes stop_codon:yes gene_type:complete
MKKIGTYTVVGGMGISSTSIGGDRQRIILDDGNFKTGYKVTKFYVWGLDTECHGTLSTVDEGGTSGTGIDYMMDAGDNTQIAWASGPSSGVGPLVDGIVNPDNLVIQDLFIRGYATSTSQPWNFYIEMDKYEITDWQGALAMVKNRAQGEDPQP